MLSAADSRGVISIRTKVSHLGCVLRPAGNALYLLQMHGQRQSHHPPLKLSSHPPVTTITPPCNANVVQNLDQIFMGATKVLGPSNSQSTASFGLLHELESIGHQLAFGHGERVIAEAEHGKGIYILRSGSARVSMTSHDGKTIELCELEPGSYIGLSSTLSCDHSCYTIGIRSRRVYIRARAGSPGTAAFTL